jgi:hypothetical protein
MIGSAPYPLTEWEWLKTQLRLRALQRSAPKFVIRYAFHDEEGRPQSLSKDFQEALIQCAFWCDTTERLLKKKACRSEHLKFYGSWAENEQRSLSAIVAHYPNLSQELDPKKHLLYTFLHSYGNGTLAVCELYGGIFHWRMSPDLVPEG